MRRTGALCRTKPSHPNEGRSPSLGDGPPIDASFSVFAFRAAEPSRNGQEKPPHDLHETHAGLTGFGETAASVFGDAIRPVPIPNRDIPHTSIPAQRTMDFERQSNDLLRNIRPTMAAGPLRRVIG